MTDWKDDIEKYRRGELTSAERHALEKKALQDTFLSDALEGAESISAENFSADLNELQESINFQGEGKKMVSMDRAASTPASMEIAGEGFFESEEKKVVNKWLWPLRIAASLFIIFGVFWTANLLIPQGGTENLALKKEETKPEPAPPASEPVNDSIVVEEKVVRSSQPKSIVEKPKQIAASKPIVAAPSSSGIKAIPTIDAKENQTAFLDAVKSKEMPKEMAEDKLADKKNVELEKAEKVANIQLSQPDTSSAKKDAARLASRAEYKRKAVDGRQFIQGHVISAEDGTPMPGVNVLVQGTTQGAVTDMNGSYQLTSVGADQKLAFSFIGYLTQEVPVANQQNIDVKLGPDVSQLSEVVVTGVGVRDDADRTPVIKLAEPAGGRKAYDNYLENSLRYPVEALTNKIKGKVTVKFTVRTDGGLDEFSVVKSLGHGCDEEVLRLVKEGPAWSPTTEDNVPVESEVLVKVRFDPAKAKK
jgi:TonB family protein